jgi:GDPmannose 4,6-dehydratase
VKVDPRYFRPTEVDTLLGDSGKARQRLGWRPSVGFSALVEEMVREDIKRTELGRNFGHE